MIFKKIKVSQSTSKTNMLGQKIMSGISKWGVTSAVHKKLTQFHGGVTYCNKLTRNCLMDNGKLDGRVIRAESFRRSTLLEVEHKKTLK